MVEQLRHRQTKGAETDMPGLPPPRHFPTLPLIWHCGPAALIRPSQPIDHGFSDNGSSYIAATWPNGSMTATSNTFVARPIKIAISSISGLTNTGTNVIATLAR